ncbi:hypothetical protein MRB53_037427 [Persea americana]|nr:hypothetical protein MRB53_037427 [Persea americana]
MASLFPGNTTSFGGGRGMQNINEDEEASHASPPVFRNTMGTADSSEASSGTFGATGFNPSDRLPPMEGSQLPTNYHYTRRTSVSAESMAPTGQTADNWTPPYHAKSEEQTARLKEAVSKNFLFSHLDESQHKQVLGALMEKPIPAKGIKVITQGDVGDYFYIVEKGDFDVYVNPAGQPDSSAESLGKKVAVIGAGGSFGELALMYNAPRAATIISTGQSLLWSLDRVTFRRIIMDSANERRKMYEAFLADVPLLKSLEPYERAKIADALSTKEFASGEKIIEEGAIGHHFYLLSRERQRCTRPATSSRCTSTRRETTLANSRFLTTSLALLAWSARARSGCHAGQGGIPTSARTGG